MSDSVKSTVVVCIVSALAGAVLLWAVAKYFPQAEEVKIDFGKDGAVGLSIKNGKTDYEAVLTSMFSKPFARAGALDWLKREQGLYHIEDRGLTRKLSEMLPERLPDGKEETLEARSERLDQLIRKYVVIGDLRENADASKPPFQPVGRRVQIGVPEKGGEQPRQYYAYVPFNSNLAGKRIEVLNPANNQSLVLLGRAAIEVSDTVNVDVQLNELQATRLFSRVPHSKIKALVFVRPGPGDVSDPTGRGPAKRTSTGL